MIETDIAIVGAGIAGASIAAMTAGEARVVLIEGETQPGYHSTGRSAAFWSESYGGPDIQPLTTASGTWLASPPDGYGERGFLSPRGCIHMADAEGLAELDLLAAEMESCRVAHAWLDRAALDTAIPGLRPHYLRGLTEPTCTDIDVGGLHAAFLAKARRSGAQSLNNAMVTAISREDGRWRLSTRAGDVSAAILVDAAGAWASNVARMAGAAPIAITPYRRTIAQLRTDPAMDAEMPLIMDALGRFYFKPEAGGRLWLSPHDETEVDAHDVAPEELDVAIAIDRFEQAVDWRVLARERAWAGLRSFSPDRVPVYGFDSRAPGFFWFAGQGGYGIQTAPAAAMVAAALLLGHGMPDAVSDIDVDRYAPTRF